MTTLLHLIRVSQGASAPAPYPDLAGTVSLYTRDFTPGKVLAKVSLSVVPLVKSAFTQPHRQVALGDVTGIKIYLAQRGDINVQLEEGELAVLLQARLPMCLEH